MCYGWAGEFTKAVEHADAVMGLYDADKHSHLLTFLNQDPRTQAGVFGSISTWVLGYPDRALRLNNEKDGHARRRSHPFNLGWALTNGAHEFDHRCTHEDLRKRAEECERLGRENNMPVLWALMAPLTYGQALIREGKVAEAVATLKAGIASWEASGGMVRSPTTNVLLAEAMAMTGDLDNALRLRSTNAPAGRNAFITPRSCGSRAGCSRSKATRRARNRIFSLSRLGAAPAGEIVGVAHIDQPSATVAGPGQTSKGV